MEAVTVLDVELDDGSRVVLSITRRGALSIQVYRACTHGRSLYALTSSGIVAPADVRDWARNLQERLETTPPASRARLERQHSDALLSFLMKQDGPPEAA